MNHTFAQVPKIQIPRSSFDRSHDYKTTFNEGYLIPFLIDEVLPADTFNVRSQLFARLATPLEFPIMDNMYLDTFYFFVPLRLIWSNFQRFMGERSPNTDSTIDFTFPKVPAPTTTGFAVNSLYDYLGLPTGKDGFSVNNYARCYNLIWNEWFRDQNLQDKVTVDVDDGPDSATDYVLLKRGKRHDYFTSALLEPQKGADVPLPLSGSAPVLGIGKVNATFDVGASNNVRESDATLSNYANSSVIDGTVSGNQIYAVEENPSASGYPYIRADLSAATATTVNALRTSVALQQFLEIDARGGTRYIELNLAHFGVISPDARLQRPEFLGSSSQRIGVNPVVQNSETATTAQGNLAAFAVASTQSGFVKSFTEHGIIMGLCSVRADLTYQQGINRMWSRNTRYDFYWPALADIGEQAVLNKEIFYSDNSSVDEDVFGYQERYGEYRYKPSMITGQFRSDAASSLDAWHLSQDFSSVPSLDNTFIQETPPIDRVVAVSSASHFLLDCHVKMICARPMKVYSVPGLARF